MAYRRCGFRYEKKLRAIGVVRIAGIDEAAVRWQVQLSQPRWFSLKNSVIAA
jgi:hypothetical protein